MRIQKSWVGSAGAVLCALTFSLAPLVGQESAPPAAQEQAQPCCTDGKCEKCQAEMAAVESSDTQTGSHRQTASFTPTIDGKPAGLATFRVRLDDGHLIAAVSTQTNRFSMPGSNGSGDSPRGFIQVYSPDLKLVEQFPLPFPPSALDVDQSGTIYVAGEGQLCRMSREGKMEQSGECPNLVGVDLEELKKEILAEAKKQQEQVKEIYQQQVAAFEDQIKKIEAMPEEERSSSDKNRLKMAKSQIDVYREVLNQQSEVNEEVIEYRLKAAANVTALAVTDKDLFVATSARTGSGYEVYRTRHDFSEPQRVIEGLRGCCGQMDIHAVGDQLFVAENTRFQVGIYDRDGQPLSSFGERLNSDNLGFGSCCNPMNVLCCGNGEILTAESSIGKIKKFNQEGELVEYIGRARIGGGCKHVAIGYDEARDRYYVQYEDANQICLLSPVSEAGNEPVDPLTKELSERLAGGTWRLASAVDQPAKSEEEPEVGLPVGITINALTDVREMTFQPNGRVAFEMQQPGPSPAHSWLPTRAEQDTLFVDVESEEDVITYRVKIRFADEETAEISVSYDGIGQEGEFRKYVLQKK